MAGVRTQCLLFIFHEMKLDVGKSVVFLDRSSVKGFALLPNITENSQFVELLVWNGFPVLSNGQDYTFFKLVEGNGNVEVIEILLEQVESNGNAHVLDGPTLKCHSQSVAINWCVNEDNMEIAATLLGGGVARKRKGVVTNIRCAVHEGNKNVLGRLLRSGADISLRHPKGGTILHLAVKRGHEPLVRMILSHNADVDVKRNDGSTALHIAAVEGFTSIVENLLQYRASPNVGTSTGLFIGSAPLHFAARKGHIKIIELLLVHGAKVDIQDFENRTSLTLTAEWAYLEAVEIMLNYRLDVIQKSSMRALCCAVNARKIEFCGMVKKRLKHALSGSSEDAYSRNLLHDAIAKNSLAIVKQLSDHGANINHLKVDDPLSLESGGFITAAGLSKEEVMKVFLEYGEDPRFRLNRESLKNERLKSLKLLIKYGARCDALNELGESLLHLACKEGSYKVVETLLQFGANPDFRSPQGEDTPLFVAISHGAAVDSRITRCQIPSHISAGIGNIEIVELLLDNGADVDRMSNEEKTPLFLAAESGSSQVVEVLLKFGACIDFRNSEGTTILSAAAGGAHLEAVQSILNYGFVGLTKDCETLMRMYKKHGCLRYGDRANAAATRKVVNLLRTQLEKLIAVQYSIIEGHPNNPNQNANHTHMDYVSTCMKEITNLKQESVGNSSLSLCDLLVLDDDRIASYLKNGSISQMLRSNDLEARFPVYGGIISSQLEKGNKRKEIMEKGIKIVQSLFRHFPSSQFVSLPDGIPEKIAEYLNNRDIGKLINAYARKDPCSIKCGDQCH